MEDSSTSAEMVKKSSAVDPTSSTHGVADTSASKLYKGVRKRKWGKWVSEIRLPNSRERIWLGSYDSPEKAARAFDAAQFCLRGRSANFNFPDNPPEIAGGRSMSPAEIQAAAARFANMPVEQAEVAAGGEEEEWRTSYSTEMESEVFCTKMMTDIQTSKEIGTQNENSSEYKGEFDCLNVSGYQNEDISEIGDDKCNKIPCIIGDVGGVEGSFYDKMSLTTTLGSGDYGSEFGLFTGFGDFNHGNFCSPQPENSINVDYDMDGEDNYDASVYQGSFLWNF